MLENVIARLEALGYTVIESDNFILNFLITKIENEIKTECNLLTIPEALENAVVDMVAGEFLLNKRNSGEVDVEAAVKSIKDGDTSVEYSDSPEKRFDILINQLMTSHALMLANYRSIQW